MNTSEFYNNLIISSIFPFQADKHPTISTSRRQSFLDGLALLLNGSSPSTSVYPFLKEKTILITRNKQLKDNDKIYFNKFFCLIREYSQHCLTLNKNDMDDIHSSLEFLVLEYNKNKCMKRIIDDLFDDAVSNLEKLPNANFDHLCQKITYSKLKKGTADYFHLKKKQMILKEYILILFDWINYIISNRNSIRKNKSNVELKIILKFQTIGKALYYSEIFNFILKQVYSNVDDYQHILYYLDKVSAHKRSLDLIIKVLKQRTFDYGEIYKNIQWYFIKPIESIVSLEEKPSLSFDKIWSACGCQNDDIKIKFQNDYIKNQLDSYDTNLKLITCLHSEIRIIDYLIEQNIQEIYDQDVEIGISKLPCYLCSLYIEKLNNKFHRKFYVDSSTTHGKIYPNWMFRKNEENMIKNSVHSQLYKLLTNEIQLLQLRIKTKSGDNDEQDTETDDDDVDYDITDRNLNDIVNVS
ncbi:unnamed protein product [Rotaria sp. Silwood1]|nr:unnamed protein product [Rotaria sp. Silwood1]CAF1690492.1 unnamed protein product [Rotaria sp. Silwood1]